MRNTYESLLYFDFKYNFFYGNKHSYSGQINSSVNSQPMLDYGYYTKQLQEARNYQSITNLPYLTTLIMPEVVSIYAYNHSKIQLIGNGFFITSQDIITCDHIFNKPNIDVDHMIIQQYMPFGLFLGMFREQLTLTGNLNSKTEALISMFSQMYVPGLTFNATISERNSNIDLARLTLQNASWNPSILALGQSSGPSVNTAFPMLGEDVAVLASPDGNIFSVTKGCVSAIRWPYEVQNYTTTRLTLDDFLAGMNLSVNNNWPLYIQFDAAGTLGSSGGPLINSKGEVIGIFGKSIIDGGYTNFAIPSAYISSVMQQMPADRKALVKMVYPWASDINSTSFTSSQAQSGPFTVAVDSPTIESQPPQTMTTTNGEQYTAYEFSVGKGTILIAEYPTSVANTDDTKSIKTAYAPDPDIKQQDIHVQSYEIDDQQGAIAQAYSPKNGVIVYVAWYLYNKYTSVIIVIEGDAQLFDNIVKSIHVQKNGDSGYSSSQTVSQSTLFNAPPSKEGTGLFS